MKKTFWDRTAKIYDRFMRKDHKAYKQMYSLIVLTFTHDGNTLRGKIKVFFMKLAGFTLYSKWSSADYLAFLQSNGWAVRKTAVLKASFSLTYAECVKEES